MSDAGDLARSMARVADGDRASLQMLYDSTSAKLFGIIIRIVVDRSEAEDVLQEVFITVWRKAAEYDPARASPITWLATIARNRAIDKLRARTSRPTSTLDLAADVADSAPDAEALAIVSDEARRVHAALATLDPRHATIIRAAYFEGLSYEALAARESLPLGTVKSWIRRGLLRMREGLAT
jgi:RNA polymerase sigma factor (sigma-70 family)